MKEMIIIMIMKKEMKWNDNENDINSNINEKW